MYFHQEMTVFTYEFKPLTLKRKSISLYFGSGQVLVGLLDFKSSDGQRCPWWVRFPCTSAKLCRTAGWPPVLYPV